MRWVGSKNGVFSVSSFYSILNGERVASFPWRMIWYTGLPPNVSFFVWTAAHNRILTINNLIRRIHVLVNRCCMCCLDAETVDHLLLHCPVATQLWSLVLAEFEMQWVQASSVLEILWSWQGGKWAGGGGRRGFSLLFV